MSDAPRLLLGLTRCASVWLGVLAATVTLVLASAPRADAVTTCSYDSGLDLLQVDMSGEFDSALLAVSSVGGQIQVRGGGPVLSCSGAGGPATVTNTNTILVVDGSDNPGTPEALDGNTSVSIIRSTEFAPGTTLESGGAQFSEIEFILNLNNGSDSLQVGGSSGADHYVLGKSGLNWNATGEPTPDVELTTTPMHDIQISADSGDDILSAQGGVGTGDAFDRATFLTLSGDVGDDTVEGGDGMDGDLIDGGPDDDVVRGFAGPDVVIGDALEAGDDTLVGGTGSDTLRYPLAQTGLSIDLSQSAPQDTGQGIDTISEIENADGSSFADTLVGNAAPNALRAMSGDDTLDGRGGSDTLDASAGSDTITYATAAAGVTVDLGAGTTTGGDTDTLVQVENVIGSPFTDSLTGSAEANAITGLGGADLVSALAGADRVDVRDGGPDVASCGTEIDTAIADRRTVDAIDPDCETVAFLPEIVVPDGGGGGGGGGQGSADLALTFRLAGARKQRLLAQKAVIVKVRCPDEACTTVTRASGKLPTLKRAAATALTKLKLKAVTTKLQPGPAKTLKLRLTKKQRKAIRARLAAGRKPKLRVSVRATDAAGNVVARSLTVTAKR